MNAMREALNAIRKTLKNAYPEHTIYVNDAPRDFARPSFFVRLISAPVIATASMLRDVRPSWQIVFFPPVLDAATQFIDYFELYSVHDQLMMLFSETMYLTTPSGYVLGVEAFDGGPRDDGGYYTLRLNAELRVSEPAKETIQKVNLSINQKEATQ